MEGHRDRKAQKLKSIDGVISPINVLNLTSSRRYSSIFDPYASDSSNSPSPLVKYLCSADPAASIDSPAVFITPVKVEEDVIVMDGIPVPKSNKGGSGEGRARLSAMSSNSVACGFHGGRSNSTSYLSSGSGSRGSGTDNSKYYKNRLCRFWETSGACQFGCECQFAHGKEQLRPPRSSGKIKLEIFKLNTSLEESSSSSYGTKYPPMSQAKASSAEEESFSLPSAPTGMSFTTTAGRIEQLSETTVSRGTVPSTAMPRSDWTPRDDGIDVKLPFGSTDKKSPSKEDVDAYIEKVLYKGTGSRNGLPVFVEICRDKLVE